MHERADERELLLHAARQLIREPTAKARELRHLEQPVAARVVVVQPVDLCEEGDVLVDAEIAVEAEPLRQIADLRGDATVRPQRIEPEHADRPAIGAQQAAQQADRRRLAGAVGTDQAEHLAARNAQRQVVTATVAP